MSKKKEFMVRDEDWFDRALAVSGVFVITEKEMHIRHPKFSAPHYLEVDNLAQKGKTIFIFEGKAKNEEEVIQQLRDRYQSLKEHKDEYIIKGLLNGFTTIRLFWYSFKRKVLVEYDTKMKRKSVQKFDELNILINILKKL